MLSLLFEKSRAGDSVAENELFTALTARFRYLVRRKVRSESDCEEIVQQALAAILESYRSVEIRSSFAAWAHRILDNKIADFYRSRKTYVRDVDASLAAESGPGVWQPDPQFRMALLECLRKVHRINRRHARMLVLAYQGFKIEEICERLSLSRANAYSVLSRARAMLAECLEKGGQD